MKMLCIQVETEHLWKSIDETKTTTPCSISPGMLKHSAVEMSLPLYVMHEKSLRVGQLPRR